VRTKNDGHWKKFTYQDISFSITLSGVLQFDDVNLSGWDLLDNQIGFTQILCRCSFNDENGNIRTIQGTVMIETSTIGISQGALVKNDFQLQGSGKLDIFDGLIPCPTAITSITVDGQEAADGIVHVSYAYTGEAYQIKYRVDGIGDYVYAVADLTLDIPGLSIADHSIEIIPVCVNGYEGTGMTEDFVVTQAMICTSSITGLVIHTDNGSKYTGLGTGVTVSIDASSDYILPTMSGSATSYKYAWDGSTSYTLVPAGTRISVTGLAAGAHSLSVIPVCTFTGGAQVDGTGFMGGFTLAAQPSQSVINYSYINFPPQNSFDIYVNGILTVGLSVSNGSGNITVATGATVKAVLSTTQPPSARAANLSVTDNTTGVILFSDANSSPIIMQYSFIANGDEFTINAVVSA